MPQSTSRRGLQVGQQSSLLYTDNPVQGAVCFSRPPDEAFRSDSSPRSYIQITQYRGRYASVGLQTGPSGRTAVLVIIYR